MLSLISFSGAIYLAYLGYVTLRTRGLENEIREIKPNSLVKGITANFLNPNPYIFWLTVGIPTAFKARETNMISVILFFFFFYLMLTGSKISIAILVERSKAFLKYKAYLITMKILGISLFFFAFYFIYDGIKLLGEVIAK